MLIEPIDRGLQGTALGPDIDAEAIEAPILEHPGLVRGQYREPGHRVEAQLRTSLKAQQCPVEPAKYARGIAGLPPDPVPALPGDLAVPPAVYVPQAGDDARLALARSVASTRMCRAQYIDLKRLYGRFEAASKGGRRG